MLYTMQTAHTGLSETLLNTPGLSPSSTKAQCGEMSRSATLDSQPSIYCIWLCA